MAQGVSEWRLRGPQASPASFHPRKQHQRNHGQDFCTCVSCFLHPSSRPVLWEPSSGGHTFVSRSPCCFKTAWGSKAGAVEEVREIGFYLGALRGPSEWLVQRGGLHPGWQPGSRARVWSRASSGCGAQRPQAMWLRLRYTEASAGTRGVGGVPLEPTEVPWGGQALGNSQAVTLLGCSLLGGPQV